MPLLKSSCWLDMRPG
ncbi:rCG45832 [Rattus norvegicus]|uniref:RCG45832 n=1 Tax=Rattus norvegicus TaxID=10116 RepID=A6JU21_RAT|nr:rCG45832 [Rattus norvegicus]